MEATAVKTIHVFVEVETSKPPIKLEFDTSDVRGRDIKERAGVPLEDDLARKQGQKLELITNDQPITIVNGEHFVVFPPGTIS